MYINPNMIDLGLEEGQAWPSDTYRIVAQAALIGNPNITNLDLLTTGVQKVLLIPADRIATVTWDQLSGYGFTIQTIIGV